MKCQFCNFYNWRWESEIFEKSSGEASGEWHERCQLRSIDRRRKTLLLLLLVQKTIGAESKLGSQTINHKQRDSEKDLRFSKNIIREQEMKIKTRSIIKKSLSTKYNFSTSITLVGKASVTEWLLQEGNCFNIKWNGSSSLKQEENLPKFPKINLCFPQNESNKKVFLYTETHSFKWQGGLRLFFLAYAISELSKTLFHMSSSSLKKTRFYNFRN